MTQPQPRRSTNPQPGAGAAVRDAEASDGTFCTCCDPKNPLVLRPDLGTLADGSAEYAICVLHEPDPRIYRNRGDGLYIQMPDLSLSAAGEIIDRQGHIIAHVAGDSFQRLSTLDDDDVPPAAPNDGGAPNAGPTAPSPGGASRPAPFHVDLSQDD
ncbi:MAG: hypothetical protein KAI47_21655, partial [Deltaproteobacteria bacterium]|nr:hypothetical protein [Deltaproteobacteria bacterium]